MMFYTNEELEDCIDNYNKGEDECAAEEGFYVDEDGHWRMCDSYYDLALWHYADCFCIDEEEEEEEEENMEAEATAMQCGQVDFDAEFLSLFSDVMNCDELPF